jgi:serine protease Do
VAIGNPFGLSHTVSAGIISAKGRTREDVQLGDPADYYNFLQTDASINHGNSGGPLLNLKGEVVGINTAIREDAQGIGFAIPINMVKQLLPMLLRDGHVTRSAIGIRQVDVHELTPEDRAVLKLTSEQGAVIEGVEPGGPADKAHLAPGDVILAFDGTPLVPGSLLRWLASTAGVGKVVTLHVSRYGKLFDADVTLGQLAEPARLRR